MNQKRKSAALDDEHNRLRSYVNRTGLNSPDTAQSTPRGSVFHNSTSSGSLSHFDMHVGVLSNISSRGHAHHPVAQSGGSTKRNLWNGLKKIAGTLNYSSSALDSLKDVVSGLYECIEAVETEAKARGEYMELQIELDSLLGDISEHISGPIPPVMTACIASLIEGIKQETERIRNKQQRNKLSRLAQATDDIEEMFECYRRIRALLERLALNANVNIWKTIDEQAT
ncbi:hypothetical protein FRC07_011502, partial [Ceratobasidium sp. 392]